MIFLSLSMKVLNPLLLFACCFENSQTSSTFFVNIMSHESALISLRRVPVAASGAGASGGLSGFLSSVLSRISNLPPVVTSLVSKATPYASWAGDLTWAVASSAVLLAIPIVVEIQRETTVRVMQKQREMETQQIQVSDKKQIRGRPDWALLLAYPLPCVFVPFPCRSKHFKVRAGCCKQSRAWGRCCQVGRLLLLRTLKPRAVLNVGLLCKARLSEKSKFKASVAAGSSFPLRSLGGGAPL